MATNTTNFNLSKPDYTDAADIAFINSNMDKVDVSLNGLADAIAIVANNNTHAAITAGQYVYVHGHGSLAEGLYTAKSNIAANATLSTSNLQADGSGGLNALSSKIATVNVTSDISVSCSKATITSLSAYRTGNVVSLAFVITLTEAIPAGDAIGVVATFTDSTLKPKNRQPGSTNTLSIGSVNISPTSSGADLVARANTNMIINTVTWLCYTYICG